MSNNRQMSAPAPVPAAVAVNTSSSVPASTPMLLTPLPPTSNSATIPSEIQAAAHHVQRTALKRLATETLIWRLKQKRAASGDAALLELLRANVCSGASFARLDANTFDLSGDTLLVLLIKLAESLDRMDEDDSAEVAIFSDIAGSFCEFSWSHLDIVDPVKNASAGGKSHLELAEQAYKAMVARRRARNADANLEGAATTLLYGLLKQVEKMQRNTATERSALDALVEEETALKDLIE